MGPTPAIGYRIPSLQHAPCDTYDGFDRVFCLKEVWVMGPTVCDGAAAGTPPAAGCADAQGQPTPALGTAKSPHQAERGQRARRCHELRGEYSVSCHCEKSSGTHSRSRRASVFVAPLHVHRDFSSEPPAISFSTLRCKIETSPLRHGQYRARGVLQSTATAAVHLI